MVAEDHETARQGSSRGWLSPGLALAAVILIYTARWIWIATYGRYFSSGAGDFCWAWDTASWISEGKVYYRDLILNLPPLAFYTLAFFIRLFRGSLWANQVHVYLWWVGDLILGLALLKRLQAGRALSVGAVLLAATLSYPASTMLHAYDSAATLFAGLTLLFLLRYAQSGKWSEALISGLAAGLGIFTKQNVGIFITVAALISYFYLALGREKGERNAHALLGFAAGWLVSFSLPLMYFGIQAGFAEVFQQMFVDPGQGKGGILRIIMRLLPRLIIIPRPHERLIEFTLSLPILIALAGYGLVKLRAARRDPLAKAPSGSFPEPRFGLWAGGYFALLIFSSLISLLDSASVRHLLQITQVHYVIDYTEVMLLVLYMVIFVMGLAGVLGSWWRRDSQTFLAAFWMMVIMTAHQASGTYNFPFATPLVIPLFLFMLEKNRLLSRVPATAMATAMFFLLLHLFYPACHRTFIPYSALPAQTPFAGLYASEAFRQEITAMWENITPKIQGKRTLWLCRPGPHAAFGGKPVFNVGFYYSNIYSSRSEAHLKNEWLSHPPDYVVFGEFQTAEGAVFLTQESLQAWLNSQYEKVWEGGPALSLWQRKNLSAGESSSSSTAVPK